MRTEEEMKELQSVYDLYFYKNVSNVTMWEGCDEPFYLKLQLPLEKEITAHW